MKTIYKYPLEITDKQTLSVPRGAKLLSLRIQDEKLCLWALVDSTHAKQDYHIAIVGTGHSIEDPFELFQYLDTFQMGGFVGHVFYKI